MNLKKLHNYSVHVLQKRLFASTFVFNTTINRGVGTILNHQHCDSGFALKNLAASRTMNKRALPSSYKISYPQIKMNG